MFQMPTRINAVGPALGDNEASVHAGIAAPGPSIGVAALSIGIVFRGFALGSWPRSGSSASGSRSRMLLDRTVSAAFDPTPVRLGCVVRWDCATPGRRPNELDAACASSF